ncbi:uncharacterized protein N0V89_012510 [Didymosphaeria variabile]|uniref:cutinase n=1 Tax=Didymosphaeria variabile TaxID=1932322 RepID=A0A9W8X9Q9_9PLEO|nr:uncharacterized protein N0V89_012510 [Didymosphaeria variabile]KAJ4344766.1 hypothetical protein N0V89_012510 [Didymosphaeria variabile]
MPPTSRLPLGNISQDQLNSFAHLSQTSASFDPNQRPLAFTRSAALGASTQNDVVNAVCKNYTLLFARGTTEQGNMGTLVGPPLAQALGKAVGADNLAVQGVDYAASVEGFLAGGDVDGTKTMAGLVAMAKSNCENTSLILSGYSQGAQLVHKAADMLTANETSFVLSAVLFGDPDNGKAVGQIDSSRTKVFCHEADKICDGQAVVDAAHLTYSLNVGEATVFVLKGKVLEALASYSLKDDKTKKVSEKAVKASRYE